MAYSQDLRDRVIDAVLVEGMSRRAAAARYGVSETAAINWVRRVELTGLRTPAKLGGYKPMMLAPHRAFLEAVCRDRPDVTLQGLCDRLLGLSGILCRGRFIVHARNLSSNMIANCVFAWLHSLGGIFHSPAT